MKFTDQLNEIHETREVITVNGYKTTHMPIYQTSIDSLDGKGRERVQLAGSNLQDFTSQEARYKQVKNKVHPYTRQEILHDEYPIHLMLGDSTYSKIRTEKVYKGNPK